MYRTHIILDLEMNPVSVTFPQVLPVLRQEIIEIGAVKLNRSLKIISRFRCLVKPEYNHNIMPHIIKLTGIRNTDVAEAPSLGDALKLFSDWIGDVKNYRIYSWSDNDLKQLRTECEIKKITFPANMRRWIDFQRPFPRMMQISDMRRHIPLKEAVQYFDIPLDSCKAHSALYDAEITAQLLVFFLNGEYRAQAEYNHTYSNQSERLTGTLGDLCNGALAELLRQMQAEPA